MTEEFSAGLIEKTLTLDRFEIPEKIDWFDKSFYGDSDFWSLLFKLHSGFSGCACKSIPFRRYDLFHDIIVRHQNRENPAFVWYDSTGHWKEISYEKLGEISESIAFSWIRAGVMPGHRVCIIRKIGYEYLISLLAGLYIGVVLSFIEPVGQTIMDKQLESLDPDYICTDDIYVPLLTKWQKQNKIINEESTLKEPNLNSAQSHTYMSGDTIALLFDPMCEDIISPKEISADFFFLSGIRDGIISLGLAPGDSFAAPGFNEILTQPAFILSVLLNGATYVFCSIKDIAKQPDLLTSYSIKILGVSVELRNILMDKFILISEDMKSWFRNPLEDQDMLTWNKFIEKFHLEDVPVSNMVWNASMGGCLLFSRRRKGQVTQNVMPMPGRKWQLCMIEDPDTEAMTCTGLFSVCSALDQDTDSYITTPCIIAETYLEYLFGGLNIASRKGIFYPIELISEFIRKIDLFKDFCIVEIKNHGWEMTSRFNLLIFLGHGHRINPARLLPEIRKKINYELGRKFALDDIQLISFCPRRGQDNDIDKDWCVFQYLNGGLKTKLNDELFLNLSRLRSCVLNSL